MKMRPLEGVLNQNEAADESGSTAKPKSKSSSAVAQNFSAEPVNSSRPWMRKMMRTQNSMIKYMHESHAQLESQ